MKTIIPGLSVLVSVLLLLTGCAQPMVTSEPEPYSFDYYSPGPTRSMLQKRIDDMTWAFWIRRLQAKGIDVDQHRTEMTTKENAIVDEVQRQTNVYERYLVVLAKEKKKEGSKTSEILTVLEKGTYSGERLNDEIIPYAWKHKRADYFQNLLDWVPPGLDQPVTAKTPAAAPEEAKSTDDGGFFGKLKSLIPKSTGGGVGDPSAGSNPDYDGGGD